ncbi:protein farnesyltransferase subunit beta [Parasteatoda tepidariorum]|uniref:protein farnesyltransferase subunit beta n=1 Tax=Parasteatoda tepidariorum TaxID=114398 RepID=UPI00077FD28B|nr:protein farnesyltransferase subunit beta [Parasteatoda tepidariorum]
MHRTTKQKKTNINLRCLKPDYEKLRFNDGGLDTVTSSEQIEVEESVEKCIQAFKNVVEMNPKGPFLERDAHLRFLKQGLTVPSGMEVLDASRPWLCYWILHSIELLGEPIPSDIKSHIIEFLRACQHPNGGFGGGPGQDAHLAPTYAAVNALCILGETRAFEVIDRDKLVNFLFRMKQPDGSFIMHEGSESDIRGVYCALSVAMLTSVWCSKLVKKTAQWVSRCQTYEGGFGGIPGMEAHGGYTFCGLASLMLLQEGNLVNIHSLLRWLVFKQMSYEGGFQGRTNKLVDSCYSFWQGGTFPIIHRLLNRTVPDNLSREFWMFDQRALQEYLLICCQAPHGGMIDKPERSRDFYHTCYSLSGLSISQHFYNSNNMKDWIVGHKNNELVQTHPIYNICVPSAVSAIKYFGNLPKPKSLEDIITNDILDDDDSGNTDS